MIKSNPKIIESAANSSKALIPLLFLNTSLISNVDRSHKNLSIPSRAHLQEHISYNFTFESFTMSFDPNLNIKRTGYASCFGRWRESIFYLVAIQLREKISCLFFSWNIYQDIIISTLNIKIENRWMLFIWILLVDSWQYPPLHDHRQANSRKNMASWRWLYIFRWLFQLFWDVSTQ